MAQLITILIVQSAPYLVLLILQPLLTLVSVVKMASCTMENVLQYVLEATMGLLHLIQEA